MNRKKNKNGVKPIDKEHIELVWRWEVNGKIFRKKKRRLYSRGRSTYCFSLDDAARIFCMYDHLFDGSSTYADNALRILAEELPPKDGSESVDSLMNKYWINIDKTVDEDMREHSKFYIENGICSDFNDYILYNIARKCDSFNKSALSVKQGFLYYLYKYIENSSLDEIKADVDQTPEYIKQLVDKMVSRVENKKHNNNQQ